MQVRRKFHRSSEQAVQFPFTLQATCMQVYESSTQARCKLLSNSKQVPFKFQEKNPCKFIASLSASFNQFPCKVHESAMQVRSKLHASSEQALCNCHSISMRSACNFHTSSTQAQRKFNANSTQVPFKFQARST